MFSSEKLLIINVALQGEIMPSHIYPKTARVIKKNFFKNVYSSFKGYGWRWFEGHGQNFCQFSIFCLRENKKTLIVVVLEGYLGMWQFLKIQYSSAVLICSVGNMFACCSWVVGSVLPVHKTYQSLKSYCTYSCLVQALIWVTNVLCICLVPYPQILMENRCFILLSSDLLFRDEEWHHLDVHSGLVRTETKKSLEDCLFLLPLTRCIIWNFLKEHLGSCWKSAHWLVGIDFHRGLPQEGVGNHRNSNVVLEI